MLQHLLLLIKVVAMKLVPDVPWDARLQTEREEYLMSKHYHGLELQRSGQRASDPTMQGFLPMPDAMDIEDGQVLLPTHQPRNAPYDQGTDHHVTPATGPPMYQESMPQQYQASGAPPHQQSLQGPSEQKQWGSREQQLFDQEAGPTEIDRRPYPSREAAQTTLRSSRVGQPRLPPLQHNPRSRPQGDTLEGRLDPHQYDALRSKVLQAMQHGPLGAQRAPTPPPSGPSTPIDDWEYLPPGEDARPIRGRRSGEAQLHSTIDIPGSEATPVLSEQQPQQQQYDRRPSWQTRDSAQNPQYSAEPSSNPNAVLGSLSVLQRVRANLMSRNVHSHEGGKV